MKWSGRGPCFPLSNPRASVIPTRAPTPAASESQRLKEPAPPTIHSLPTYTPQQPALRRCAAKYNFWIDYVLAQTERMTSMRQIRNHSLHCLRCSANSAYQPTIRTHSTLRSRFVPLSSPKLSYRAIQVYEETHAGCNDSQLKVQVREGTGFLRTLGIQHSFSPGIHFTPLLLVLFNH